MLWHIEDYKVVKDASDFNSNGRLLRVLKSMILDFF